MMVQMYQLRMLLTFDARGGAAGTYLNERWDLVGSRIVSTDPNLPWGRTRARERLLTKKRKYCHDVGSAFDHRGVLAWTQLRHQRQSQQYANRQHRLATKLLTNQHWHYTPKCGFTIQRVLL